MNIVVLEDSKYRVDWLVRETAGKHVVMWAKTVSQFLDVLSTGRPGLVILDHDLGDDEHAPSDMAYNTRDVDGLDGRDAVRVAGFDSAPVLVWSWNAPAAKAMVETLKERGVTTACASYGTVDCKALIRQFLGL